MANKSRAKALKINAITSILSEIVTLICGLILPRVILLFYGSTTNGLVSSIAQFLGFSVVLRSGIGAVTKAALYKPLAEGDINEISAIMAATKKYMQKIALILAGCILVLAVVYPFIVLEDYSWFYTFCMVLVLGLTTFTENFFGIKNMILLQADQKYYVQTIAFIISQVLSCLVSVLLMYFRLDMLYVKMGAAVAFLSNPLLLELYVRKKYKIDKTIPPNNLALKQRWSAFFQQLAIIINGNVDIVLITFLSPLSSVSVYTVHFMIVNNISKVVQAPVQGVGAAFGDMLAKEEMDNLRKSFMFMEWAVFALATLLFAITASMINSFIQLYTASVTDANYYQPLFALLMVIAVMLNCLRIPYQSLTEAAGHFKQTRNGAILEVIINLVVSIVLLIFIGLIGVVIGTLCSCLIRTIQYSWYSTKKILNVSILHVVKNYLVYLGSFALCVVIGYFLVPNNMSNYLVWILYSVYMALISFAIIVIFSLIFNRTEVKYLFNKLKSKRKFKENKQ